MNERHVISTYDFGFLKQIRNHKCTYYHQNILSCLHFWCLKHTLKKSKLYYLKIFILTIGRAIYTTISLLVYTRIYKIDYNRVCVHTA